MRFYKPEHKVVARDINGKTEIGLLFERDAKASGHDGQTGLLVPGQGDDNFVRTFAASLALLYTCHDKDALELEFHVQHHLSNLEITLVYDEGIDGNRPFASADPFARPQLTLPKGDFRTQTLNAELYEKYLNRLVVESIYVLQPSESRIVAVRRDSSVPFQIAIALVLSPADFPTVELRAMDLSEFAERPATGNWFNINTGERAYMVGVAAIFYCDRHAKLEHLYFPANTSAR